MSMPYDGEYNDSEILVDAAKDQYQTLRIPEEPGDYSKSPADQRRILKNLPFAYRGYIFKNKELQDYFESTEWYLPNPEYNGDMEALSTEEKKWVEFWK